MKSADDHLQPDYLQVPCRDAAATIALTFPVWSLKTYHQYFTNTKVSLTRFFYSRSLTRFLSLPLCMFYCYSVESD